jgi:hypothetical protein
MMLNGTNMRINKILSNGLNGYKEESRSCLKMRIIKNDKKKRNSERKPKQKDTL